jgi:hypothetical protein
LGALGGNYVGFGTECQDFDLDGQDEIIVTNGHVLKYPVATPRKQSPLFLVLKDERLVQLRPQGDYFEKVHEGRGLATADVNSDGKLDILISHINSPCTLLINCCDSKGTSLSVKLVGTVSNREAVGARIILNSNNGKRMRNVVGGGSYLSHSDRTVQFAIQPDEIVESLIVYWPNRETPTELEIATSSQSQTIVSIEPSLD